MKDLPGRRYDAVALKSRELINMQKALKVPVPEEKRFKNGARLWTTDENEKLLEGIKRFGRDHVKIAKVLRTRSREDICRKIEYCAKNYKNFPIDRSQIRGLAYWSEIEKAAFINVIKKHGWNLAKL